MGNNKKRIDIRLDLTPEEYDLFNEALLKFARTQNKYRVTYKQFIMFLAEQVSQWQVT